MEKTLNKLDEKCEHFKIPSKKEGPGGFWHCRVITELVTKSESQSPV